MRAKLAVGAADVAILAEPLRKIKDDGNGKQMVLARQLDQRLSRLRLHVCGINHGELAAAQPLAHNGMKQIECIIGRRLVVLVVRDQGAACIRRHNLSRQEVLASKGGFAAAGGANQNNQ